MLSFPWSCGNVGSWEWKLREDQVMSLVPSVVWHWLQSTHSQFQGSLWHGNMGSRVTACDKKSSSPGWVTMWPWEVATLSVLWFSHIWSGTVVPIHCRIPAGDNHRKCLKMLNDHNHEWAALKFLSHTPSDFRSHIFFNNWRSSNL